MTKEQKKYLDDLRESGEANMWEAVPRLQEQFGLSVVEARKVLSEWMESCR